MALLPVGEVRPELKEIWIKNFKSLKDVRVRLGRFNLLIGPNRSGKTNFLEALDLLRAIYFPRPGSEQVSPFLRWWGYDRAVWRRDESLPITIGLLMDIAGYEVLFETTFTGIGGAFRLLREVVDVKGVVRLEKEGGLLRIRHDEDFLDRAWEEVEEVRETAPSVIAWTLPELKRQLAEVGKEGLVNYTVELGEGERSCFLWLYGKAVSACYLKTVAIAIEADGKAIIFSPAISAPDISGRISTQPLTWAVRSALRYLLENVLILRPLDARKIREQMARPIKERRLSEDALNLHSVLYLLFMEKGGLPERVEAAIKDIFGEDVSIAFTLTEDGRVYMRVFEGDLGLDPPMVSDGFYKVLAILTAIETRPSILAVDELENSLHLEAIERILDELRDADCTVIAITHSPLVMDLVDPANIILVERDEEGATVMRRIPDPEALKKRLAEHGLTFSEGWLYGRVL